MHEKSGYNYAYSVFFNDVAKINFTSETPQNAHIAFGQMEWSDGNLLTLNDDEYGAFSRSFDPNHLTSWANNYPGPSYDYSLTSGEGAHGDIWLNSDFVFGWNTADEQKIQFYTILHELGHSLGLEHPDSNPNIDNIKYTMMSSNPMEGMVDGANTVLPSGLQLFDIAAIQAIYGANTTTRAENETVYKMGSGQAFGETASTPFIYTIWDGGGDDDVIDTTGYEDLVTIDLREGYFSSIGKAADTTYAGSRGTGLADDNVAIAYGTEIENAIGTDHNDHLIGNDLDNHLQGGAGNDTIEGNAGDDIIDGGADHDIADYSGVANGITVTQSGSNITVTGEGVGTDTLLNMAANDNFGIQHKKYA